MSAAVDLWNIEKNFGICPYFFYKLNNFFKKGVDISIFPRYTNNCMENFWHNCAR